MRINLPLFDPAENGIIEMFPANLRGGYDRYMAIGDQYDHCMSILRYAVDASTARQIIADAVITNGKAIMDHRYGLLANCRYHLSMYRTAHRGMPRYDSLGRRIRYGHKSKWVRLSDRELDDMAYNAIDRYDRHRIQCDDLDDAGSYTTYTGDLSDTDKIAIGDAIKVWRDNLSAKLADIFNRHCDLYVDRCDSKRIDPAGYKSIKDRLNYDGLGITYTELMELTARYVS